MSFGANQKSGKQEVLAVGNTFDLDLELEAFVNSFHIPGLDDQLIAFQVQGNSMAPTIQSGDLVICTLLENINEIVDNGLYVIITQKAIWMKRVKKTLSGQGIWTHLQLFSENSTEQEPFLLAVSEVEKALKVKQRLTTLA